jgi:hypothetical protein
VIPGSVCEARNATSKVASAKSASWSLVALCGSSSRASAICLRTFQRHRADAADNGLHLAVAGLWRLDREDDQESQGVREALERLHGGRHDPAEVFGGASRSPVGILLAVMERGPDGLPLLSTPGRMPPANHLRASRRLSDRSARTP